MTAHVCCLGLLFAVAFPDVDSPPAKKAQQIEETILARLRRDLSLNEPKTSFAIWIKELNGNRLVRPTLKVRDARGRDAIIAQAAEGRLRADPAKGELRITLFQGEISRDGGKNYAIIEQETVVVPLPKLH